MNRTDIDTLQGLARRVAEIAQDPVMEKRKTMWQCHHRLERIRPMILVFPEGSWRELLPDKSLTCTDPMLRSIEADLRRRIYTYEHFDDDTVIEGHYTVHKVVTDLYHADWGLPVKRKESSQATGAFGFDPVLNKPADIAKLRAPEVVFDEHETLRRLEIAHELFDPILHVRLKGVDKVGFHISKLYSDRRGLQQMLSDMYDNPNLIHDAMSIFRDGYRRFVAQLETMSLLDINNDETYNHTGGCGYTTELPQRDWRPDHVRPADMWSFAESQELARVSPEQHEEFALRYERELLEPFGLTGYGCCEPLHDRIEQLLTIPNLRMISISPFADVEQAAADLQDRAIFSWKPNPAHLVGDFSASSVKEYIRRTLEATRDCVVQIVLKDTHTCENHPERFTEWTRIAKQLAEEH